MKAILTALAVLLFSNVAAVASLLHAAGVSWIGYVNLFGVALFGYFVGWLVFRGDVQ